jgi:hypothetical protein
MQSFVRRTSYALTAIFEEYRGWTLDGDTIRVIHGDEEYVQCDLYRPYDSNPRWRGEKIARVAVHKNIPSEEEYGTMAVLVGIYHL